MLAYAMCVLATLCLVVLPFPVELYIRRREPRYLYLLSLGWLLVGVSALIYIAAQTVGGVWGPLFEATMLAGVLLLVAGALSYFTPLRAARVSLAILAGCSLLLALFIVAPGAELLGMIGQTVALLGPASYGLLHRREFIRVGGRAYYWLVGVLTTGGLSAAVWLHGSLTQQSTPVWPWVGTTAALMLGALFLVVLELSATQIVLEQKQRELEEYATVFAVTPDLLSITDVDWHFDKLNPAWEQTLGYTPDELRALPLAELVHPDDVEAAIALNARLADGEPVRGTNRFLAKDGTYRWLEWTSSPVTSDGRVVAAARDVTEHVEADRALQSALDDLARSNRDLQEFAQVVSHDLREPLRATSTFASLLASRYEGRLDADADDFIGFIVDGAERMQRMITDLLLYSRVGSRGESFAPTDAEEALEEARANLATAIEEAGASVTNDPLPTVVADRTQLMSVFQNLIANAIQFRGPDAPQVHVSAEQHGDEWVFLVEDNGIGVEAAEAERIFAVFRRGASSQGLPGTGMGLAVVKRVANRHGGRAWVEPRVGGGSAFRFSLRVEPAEDVPAD